MSVAALEIHASAPAPPASAPAPCGSDAGSYVAAIRVYTDVATSFGDDGDVDALLRGVAAGICSLLDLPRCSVYLRDRESGILSACTDQAGRTIDPAVRQFVGAIAGIRLTREILATRKPAIAHAPAQPELGSDAAFAWGLGAVVGVPLHAGDQVIGALYLDNGREPYAFTLARREAAAAFAVLAATAIRHALVTAGLRERTRMITREHGRLRRHAAISERLGRFATEGRGLGEIARMVSELTGKPCAIHDTQGRRMAAESPEACRGQLPRLLDDDSRESDPVRNALARLDAPTIIGPFPAIALRHRFLVAPVASQDAHLGHVVVMEYGTRLERLDEVVANRAAILVSAELRAQRRAATARAHELESLASALVRGSCDPASLERRAQLLGVGLSSPHVVCLIRPVDARGCLVDARRVASAIEEETSAPTMATVWKEEVVVIVALPRGAALASATARAKEVVSNACRRISRRGRIAVAISSVCRAPGDYVAALAEAQDIMAWIDVLSSHDGGELRVLAAADLGIGRLLLSTADRTDAVRFAEATLGSLLDESDQRMGVLVRTLGRLFECSLSRRRTAEALGVHENTIRYRLQRIDKIAGLDLVGNAEHRLAAHLALLVLRLEGRLPAAAP